MSTKSCLESKPSTAEANIVSTYPSTELWDMTFGERRDIEDWYEWFHQGVSKAEIGKMDKGTVNKQYKKFMWLTKKYEIKKMIGDFLKRDYLVRRR